MIGSMLSTTALNGTLGIPRPWHGNGQIAAACSETVKIAASGAKYQPSRELRVAANAIPEVATARKKMADVYRKMRSDNPAMARLLFRRISTASKALAAACAKSIFEEGTGGGGLRALLPE